MRECCSLSHPLMTKFARTFEGDNVGAVIETNNTSEKAAIDMTNSSLRPKIYLLIKRIVEATHTTATLFDGLSLINQILLQVILSFMDLKTSEVYTDMDAMMEKHGLSFSPKDEPDASNLVTVAKNTIASVLETQRFLLRRSKENESIKETEFYDLVKQCRLQDHLKASREVDYFARTSNYPYLIEKRLWQKMELEGASKHLDESLFKNSRVHKTSGGHLNITTWSLRTRNVAPEQNGTGDVCDYEDNEESVAETTEAPALTTPGDPLPSAVALMRPAESIMSVQASSTTLMFKEGTPEPFEGGFYQISPYLLRQALESVLEFRKQNTWLALLDQDEENHWKLGKKWRQDWYPLTRIKGGLDEDDCKCPTADTEEDENEEEEEEEEDEDEEQEVAKTFE